MWQFFVSPSSILISLFPVHRSVSQTWFSSTNALRYSWLNATIDNDAQSSALALVCLTLLVSLWYYLLRQYIAFRVKDIKKQLFLAELLPSCISYVCQIYQMLSARIFSFSTKIGSQWQAKKWRKFYQHSQLITEVLDYFVAAMVDATTHSSSLLSFLEKKPFSYYFQLLNHGQLLQIWSY